MLTIDTKSNKENIPAHILRALKEELVDGYDEKELIKRDAERDVWQETLESVRSIKSGHVGSMETVELPTSQRFQSEHQQAPRFLCSVLK